MTKIFNFVLKIKGGGREGGMCEVLRPCHPPKIWNVHQNLLFSVEQVSGRENFLILPFVNEFQLIIELGTDILDRLRRFVLL